MIDNEEGFIPCPDSIAVIGGGRWSRVLTEVVCGLVPPSVEISVHSLHNAKPMSAWVLARGFGQRVQVSSEWPRFASSRSSAVIVVNAARGHEMAVEWALSAGVPVLVEKPIAITAVASQRLVDMSRSRNIRFAAAHVFLFARYLENFSKLVVNAGRVQFLRVQWTDPRSESRYGEQKQYDPSLPVFADWLPHVLSIVGTLTPGLPGKCEIVRFLRGGAHVELDFMLGDVPCSVQLIRNSDQRRRIIEVVAGRKMLQIDFSKEPGTITCGSTTMVGDQDWEVKKRPVARMLTAFLKWAAGGEYDNRLNVEVGLLVCKIIDQIADKYRAVLTPWLITRLVPPCQVDDDLRYALSEMLQSEGTLPTTAVEHRIERMRQRLCETDGIRRLKEFAGTPDPATLIRALAT